MNQHYQGLIPAVFTPMHEDGTLALDRIERYAERLVAARVSGVFVGGTTGESASLTVDERFALTARWIQVLRGQLPVIVHVGHPALPEAQALAQHAAESGAAAISTLAPFFFKPGVEELVSWCAAVALAAPRLPFYYYHIPSMTGVNVPVAQFFAAAEKRIPTLAGAKFTFEDLLDLQNAMRLSSERWEVLFGRDEILLAGLALGCRGAVGSTYNFAAPIYQRVIDAYRANDLQAARNFQQHAAEFIQVMIRHGGLAAAKVILRQTGIDCGPTRLPLRRLTTEQSAALEQDLQSIDFFDQVAVG